MTPEEEQQLKQRKQELLDGLKDLVWKTYEAEETIQNFGPESQAVLNDRLFRFIEGVRGLVPLTRALNDVQIPVDMLQYVDQGGNPHQYTAEVFRACTRDNQVSKGKVEAVNSLHNALLAQMETAYPQQTNEYRAMVEQQGQLQEQQELQKKQQEEALMAQRP